jgi:WD40 repeat protein
MRALIWLVILLSLLLAVELLPAQPIPNSGDTDSTTEPLPPGALLRFGSVRFRSHAPIVDAVFSPDGKSVVSISQDNVLLIWDSSTGRHLQQRRIPGAHIERLIFSPNGRMLAGLGLPDALVIWDARSFHELLRLGRNPTEAYLFTWVGSNKMAVAKPNKTVSILELTAGKEEQSWRPGFYDITALASSPDGSRLVVMGDDKKLKSWDVARRREEIAVEDKDLPRRIGIDKSTENICLSPDGMYMATTASQQIIIWDEGKRSVFRKLASANPSLMVFSPGRTIWHTLGNPARFKLPS